MLLLAIACVGCNPSRISPGDQSDENPAFEPDAVVVVFDQGATLQVLLSGPGIDTDLTETLTATDLQAMGARAVPPAAFGSQLVANARMVWIHRSALARVPPTVAQQLLSDGVAVGLLDGSADELQQATGIPSGRLGMIQAGAGRPVYVLVQRLQCDLSFEAAGRISSDWLTRHAFMAASRSALALECTAGVLAERRAVAAQVRTGEQPEEHLGLI